MLARLQEDQVRHAVAAVLEVDRSFDPLTPEAVTDDDIHAACITADTAFDVSDVVGSAEFQAALLAIRSARRRLASD